MLKQPRLNELLDLADTESVFPSRPENKVQTDGSLWMGRILVELQEPMQTLWAKLNSNDEDLYEFMRESAALFESVEQDLRLLRESGSFVGVESLGQLAIRVERALSYLNCVAGGLAASGKASSVDLLQLKCDLNLVGNILRDVTRIVAATQKTLGNNKAG